MKHFRTILTINIMILILVSCGEPDALVVNVVHKDGSITRKVILTSTKDNFDLDDCQVPVNKSWDIEKISEISEKGDTTWTLTAIKDFESVDGLNTLYETYEGSNGAMKRKILFRKRFLWFNTEYYFAETIEKAIEGFPPEEFFTGEQLNYFYMPDEMEENKMKGPDSTRVKEIIDGGEEVYDEWLEKSLLKQFCLNIIDLTGRKETDILLDTILNMNFEGDIFDMEEDKAVDYIFGQGFYSRNEALVDSASNMLDKRFEVAFSAGSYLIQTEMPGDLTATNGYIDSEDNILWKVDGEVFLSKDYVMWAESKTTNTWAWVVTGAFVIFVMTGLIIRKRQAD